MQEIEVKARVKNMADLATKLEALGCKFSEPISQRDRIFIPKGVPIPVGSGGNVFRIRNQDGKIILTVKQQISNQLDCLEHEVEISNVEEMVGIFKLIGLEEMTYVNKRRRKCKYKDMEICLDEIEEIGNFVEVEKLSTGADSVVVQEELFNFLESVGVRREDREENGYDILVYNFHRSSTRR